MPRAKKSGDLKKKGKWKMEDLHDALKAIAGGMSVRRAASTYNVPYSTIRDRLNSGLISGPNIGRPTVFTKEQELVMTEEIKILSKLFYGLTPAEIRSAVFEFAETHGIQHSFNGSTRMAGRAWLDGFISRNPTLAIRRPENTSFNRITGFNQEEVAHFFSNWIEVNDKYKFPPARIFNMDETGINVVPDSVAVVAEKGQKRVGVVASGERGRNVTVICAVSAAGEYVPPMFIYPRKRMAEGLSIGGPPGAIYCCSNNGYSDAVLFMKWLNHFVQNKQPSLEDPVAIVLDNHDSHISLEAYNFCRQNGIILVSLPPHTSNRMQPLDVSFFGPLKGAFRRESAATLRARNGKKITVYELAAVFNKAYQTVASMKNAVSGFEASGIWPINPNVFSPDEFIPAAILKNAAEGPGSSLLEGITIGNITELDLPIVIQNGNDLIPLDAAQLMEENQPSETDLINPGLHSVSRSLEIPQNYLDPEEMVENTESAAHVAEENTGILSEIGEIHLENPEMAEKISERQKEDLKLHHIADQTPLCSISTPRSARDSTRRRRSTSAGKISKSRSPSHNRVSERAHTVLQALNAPGRSITDSPTSRVINGTEAVSTNQPQISTPPFNRVLYHGTTPASSTHQLQVATPSSSLYQPSVATPASSVHQIQITPSPDSHQARASTPTLLTPGIRELLGASSPISQFLKPFSPTMPPQIVVLNVSTPTSANEMRITSPAPPVQQAKPQKKGHSTILTGSPMKKVLEDKKRKRDEKEEKVRMKNIKIEGNVKRRRVPKKVTSGNIRGLRTKKSEDEEEQAQLCNVCQEYGKDEVWFRCRGCGSWAHADCVAVTTADEFICDDCQKS